MEEIVRCKREGPILWILLNSPETLNAMSLALIEGLARGVKEASNPAIRCVVLRGEGRGFCSGGDLRSFRQWYDSGKGFPEEMPEKLHSFIEDLRNLEKPVLAVAHGPCAGAGTSLILACDLVLAAEDAKFNLAYTKIGLSPDGSSTFFLPRHVGLKRAAELFILGRTLSAREAYEWGLVNWVVPLGELEGKAQEIAKNLAAGASGAFGKVKKLLNASWTNNLHDQLALETKLICDSAGTGDFGEGLVAFFEKRPPRFQGS